MPFPGLVPNRVTSSAFPSPLVSRNASTPPPGDWSATKISPLGATAMSRTLAGPPVDVLASYTTRAQKPLGRFRPPLSGSQVGRAAEPGAAILWDAWAGPVGPALAWTQTTIATSRGTTARTLGWTRMRPPRSRDVPGGSHSANSKSSPRTCALRPLVGRVAALQRLVRGGLVSAAAFLL